MNRTWKGWLGAATLCVSVDALLVGAALPPKFSGWQSTTVKPGQTLWNIAYQYEPEANTSDVVNAILSHNHVTNIIQPGETLEVPTKTVPLWRRLGF